MSLLDAFNTLKQSGFDAKKDKDYNPYKEIPDGEYLVSLDGVTHNAKNDRDFLMISFMVVQGEYEGQKESVFPSLATKKANGDPMPNSVIARGIAEIQLIGEAVGAPIPDSCFAHDNETDAYEAIVPVLSQAKNKVLKLTKKTTPNKRNPDYPYKNYEFEKAEQPRALDIEGENDPFKDSKNNVEVNGSDFPF
ncbi:hypothetical protein J2Z60_000146 [Lactobacillus colini]|uniref:Single-stranded DNA-binding protein n=1 Tax=Lactobacillus colini TaxID=1819254 RepID=A0ABS4MBE4_9LACO|nr:single-stranded DNA-binding protein [Lactobacillus colini]MBP2056984.1 hypothetical protein [Lactobacillus colini]